MKNNVSVKNSSKLDSSSAKPRVADQITITCYTDPLCCWSWAMKPALDNIRQQFGNSLSWQYRMAGLIPSWENYIDSTNSVSRPFQMGPVWMHASSVSGVPIDANLWFRDPPASSYPPCIAFKSVQLQSEEYATTYLNMLWENCMGAGINISRQSTLINLGEQLKLKYPDFDMDEFENSLVGGTGLIAFKADIRETKEHNITRLPALILRQPGKASLFIMGYKPYDYLLNVIQQLVSEGNTAIKL
jgi:putative protein-disulfide isomerase